MRDEWTRTTLGEICKLTKGATPTMKATPGPYPLIVTAAEPLTSDSFQFEGEAVCVPMVSSTGHGHASLKRVHYASGRFAVANIITALQRQPDVPLDMKYLWLLLDHGRDEIIVPLMKGTANVSLSQRALAAAQIVLPPLEEQRRIVDLVGALDDTIAAVGASKVAAEHSLSHCADQLVAEADGLVSQLGDVLSVVRGGSPRPIDEFYTTDPEGLPWIRIGDVEADGKYIWRTEKKIRAAGLSKTRTVSSGDFLLSNSMSFGRPYITRVDGCIHDGWLRLSGFEECFTEDYLYYLLRSASIQARFQSLAAGSSVQNLNKDKVAGVPVTVPSLDYQRRASTSLDAILAVVDGLDREADRLERLRSNLLTALLSGEHEIPESYDEWMEAVG